MTLNKRVTDLTRVMGSVFETALVQAEENCVNSKLGEFNLKEAKAISFIASRGSCIMKELSDGFSLPLSTTTGLIDKLVKKGVVLRERSEEERRIVRIQLTAEGNEIARQVEERNQSTSEILLKALTIAEQEQFVSLFQKIHQNL